MLSARVAWAASACFFTRRYWIGPALAAKCNLLSEACPSLLPDYSLILLHVHQLLDSQHPPGLILHWEQIFIRLVIIFIIKKIHRPNGHVDSIIIIVASPR